jgi:membrane peptidoglycan carboxypeptidase
VRQDRHSAASIVGRVVAFGLVAASAGVMTAGLFVPAAIGASAATRAGSFVLAAPAGGLAQTSVMLAADGSPLTYFYDENRTVVALRRMSPLVRQAIVAVEDNRFYTHGPVDPRGLARAVLSDLVLGSRQGASTLTQQYVKNVLVEQATLTHDPAAAAAAVAPTLARKVRELKLAVSVEQQLTKDAILERYLNIVHFGSHTYGIEAVARRYFAVPAARLNLAQAATLAGVVQDPAAFDPATNPARARTRRDVVLADMLTQHMISPAAYRRARATAMVVHGSAPPNGCAAAAPSDGYFCGYVVRSIATDPRFAALGATAAARLAAISRDGLVIRTTLDPGIQASAVRALVRRVPVRDASGVGAAAVTVEPGTGQVLGMAQNRVYGVTAGAGRTSINYSVDADLGGAQGFQTGSSFKPFTLAAWLASGRSTSDVVDATPRAFSFSDFTACGSPLRGRTPYQPGNSEGTETGPMSVQSATANSVNVAFVAMESQLDLCDVAQTAQRLGVHVAAAAQPCSTSEPATEKLPTCLPSLTLGVADIAPLTMAAAYASFATGGQYCPPDPVTAITRSGSPAGPGARSTLRVAATPCRTALAPGVASGVNGVLQHVLTDGTAASVGPLASWPSAGKTGTTNGPRDTWLVGYTTQRSTAVWVGDPGTAGHSRRPLRNVTIGGRYRPTVFGATIAAPIWKELMTAAQSGLPGRPLP